MTDKIKDSEQESNVTPLPVKPKSQSSHAGTNDAGGTAATNKKPKLPLHIELAEEYLNKYMEPRGCGLLVVPDSNDQTHFWKYENGLWTMLLLDKDVVKWLEPELQAVLIDHLDKKKRSKNSLFSEATQHIIRSPIIRGRNSPIEWDAHGKIPTKKGLIDPLTLQIEPIRKEHYCTWRLNIEYDPTATCPKWLEMLADSFSDRTPEDRDKLINLLQEFTGLCLIANRSKALSCALVLWGPTDCGKTAIIAVISGLLSDNPITTSFKDLTGDHGLQAFLRRGVPWVLHEAFTDNVWHPTNDIKAIISGDPISINPKYGAPITIKPNAPPIWGSNHGPKFKDSSEGTVERLKIIHFTKQFDKNNPIGVAAEARKINPTWEPQHLVLNTERAGVFNWALAGLKRALERGHFIDTAAGEELLEEARKDSNVVAGFNEDCIEYDDNVMISSVDYCAAFAGWWSEQHGNEKTGLSPTLIGSHLADLCDPLIAQNKKKFKDRDGLRFYVGIKLNKTAGKLFFESKLDEDLSGRIHTAIPRMSHSYEATIRPIPPSWLEHEEIKRLKANAAKDKADKAKAKADKAKAHEAKVDKVDWETCCSKTND
jgi:P4 family phage/plasmid primase-like protien